MLTPARKQFLREEIQIADPLILQCLSILNEANWVVINVADILMQRLKEADTPEEREDINFKFESLWISQEYYSSVRQTITNTIDFIDEIFDDPELLESRWCRESFNKRIEHLNTVIDRDSEFLPWELLTNHSPEIILPPYYQQNATPGKNQISGLIGY